MSSTSKMRHPALAAIAMSMVLPSGPALGNDASFGQSPALWLAQASVPTITQPAQQVLELDAAEVSKGMILKHDGPVRIIGDIMGDGPEINIQSPDLEVVGSIRGSNIHLLTADPDQIDLYDAASHQGRLKIRGDVHVWNSRLGGAGTAQLDVLGNAIISGFPAPGQHESTTIIGRKVCIAGNLSATGTPKDATVAADQLRIGHHISGHNLTMGIYSGAEMMRRYKATGELPDFQGLTEIGGHVLGSDMTISNGEVRVGGAVQGERLRVISQRIPIEDPAENLSCEPTNAATQYRAPVPGGPPNG